MSSHSVPVIRIESIEAHPNADALELVHVWGYTCAIRKGSFKVGDLAAYIEPDYEVPLGVPAFAFLQKPGKNRVNHRIAVTRLRGVYSQGLLIPAPEGAKEGDNVMDHFGITRWEPSEEILVKGAFAEKGPDIFAPKYDLENWRKYRNVLIPGENIILTPKIHGTNARFVWAEDRMWCGSRTQWKVRPGVAIESRNPEVEPQIAPPNAWWTAHEQLPWIEEWCKANPGVVIYGEIFGPGIQKGYHYGMKSGQVGFAVFDVLKKGKWVPNSEFSQSEYSGLHFVPVLYAGKNDASVIMAMAEKDEDFNGAGHIREGVVIKLENERFDVEVGRVALKHVSDHYYEDGKKS